MFFSSQAGPLAEIGLRRALGATQGQIRTQFLGESILLAVIDGGVRVLAGAVATAVYASSKGWAVVIPVEAWSGGIASAILIGAFAGLMPAVGASRMPPTVALRAVLAGRGCLSRGHPAAAFEVSVASWAMAMARTMDSPRPWWSSKRVRSGSRTGACNGRPKPRPGLNVTRGGRETEVARRW
ncbi:MAG: ABC transporter permease [Chloroflexota bacterium]|nr:ABC transporter permease [Chloroflexota bacterium]